MQFTVRWKINAITSNSGVKKIINKCLSVQNWYSILEHLNCLQISISLFKKPYQNTFQNEQSSLESPFRSLFWRTRAQNLNSCIFKFWNTLCVFASAIPLMYFAIRLHSARGIEHNNQQSAVFTKTHSARRGEIADHCAISANFQLTPIRRAAFYCETAKSTCVAREQTTKHTYIYFPFAAVGALSGQ